MKRRLRSLTTWSIALASWGAVWIASPGAQAPGAAAAKTPGEANWLTDGGDNERTAWQKNETRISTESVKNMKLLWKLQFDNQPRQMHNLFPPLIVTDVTTAQGPKEVAVVAGVSDNIYGVDGATGTRLWSRKFDSTFVEQPGGRGGGVLCPTASVAPSRRIAGASSAIPFREPKAACREESGLAGISIPSVSGSRGPRLRWGSCK